MKKVILILLLCATYFSVSAQRFTEILTDSIRGFRYGNIVVDDTVIIRTNLRDSAGVNYSKEDTLSSFATKDSLSYYLLQADTVTKIVTATQLNDSLASRLEWTDTLTRIATKTEVAGFVTSDTLASYALLDTLASYNRNNDTLIFSVNANQFRPGETGALPVVYTDTVYWENIAWTCSDVGGCDLRTTVHLPDSAVIVDATAYSDDGSGNWFLERRAFSNNGGSGVISTTTLNSTGVASSNEVVDNDNYNYIIKVDIDDDERLYGAKVRYLYIKP